MDDMKTFIFLLAFSIPAFCYSQWTGVYYHSDQENKIEVINKDTIIAVTAWDGRIHRSTNAGKHWSSFQTIFKTSWFLDVHFPTSSVGYACGGTAFGMHRNVIAKTINSGQSWDSISSNDFSGYNITNVHFLNADTGFFAQESVNMLVTLDGGNSFNVISTPGAVTDITSTSNQDIFIALSKYISNNTYAYSIAKSDDMGDNWSIVYSDTMDDVSGFDHRRINKLFFLDNNHGYAVGGNGLFLKSTDGGESWESSQIYPFSANLTAIHFTSPDIGYINNNGGIYRTDDAGLNWTVQTLRPLSIIHQIQFANDSIGYALGDMGIFKTSNGGKVVSIDENSKQSGFNIYPNPTSDRIFLAPFEENTVAISIYNQVGQKVLHAEVKNEVDVSHLPKGLYILVISEDGYQQALKFVKN